MDQMFSIQMQPIYADSVDIKID